MSGFTSPTYTQAPNDLFDHLMKDMSEAELKVILAAIRQTFGYHKAQDAISLTQFQRMTGLSRQSVLTGIDGLVAKGLLNIVGQGKRGTNIYGLVVILDQSNILTSTSQNFRPVDPPTSLNFRHTKEKDSKENTQNLAPDGAAKPKAIPQQLMNPMKDALVQAFKWDWETMTSGEKGMIQKAAKELCTANLTPADATALHAYCVKQFDHISPPGLLKHVSDWRKSSTPAKNGKYDPATEAILKAAGITEIRS